MAGRIRTIIAVLVGVALSLTGGASTQPAYRSHPPMRALPGPSHRSLDKGPSAFVDPIKGDDRHEGTEQKPWKTINRAVKQRQAGPLQPGATLYLRGGTYYESVTVAVSGTAEKPITIRSYPGELAVIDGGLREFYEAPRQAWEPVEGGAEGEFRSTKSYDYGGGFGNFGDSMVPFHRYMTFADLRSDNELHRDELKNRADDPQGIYAGPGVRRDAQIGRIHIRLAHTQLAGLGANHYRGETDPRRLPLVIAGHEYSLQITGARHLRIQDLVVRGAKRSAIRIADAENLELDGVTLYGSGMALRVSRTCGLRLVNSNLRGHAAPWHSRFHHKNRAGAGYLVLVEGSNFDFEFAFCEFTNHHDGLLLSKVEGMRFHHNLVDNFNDDGIELGAKKARGQHFIYQNFISRCLNPLTAHGKKPIPVVSEAGSGSYIYRNILDLRQGTYKSPPGRTDPTGTFLNHPTTWLAHNHGSPILPNYYVYQNTFLLPGNAMRGYYAFTWGSHTRGTTRRVFNNIFVQDNGIPGLNFSMVSADDDFQADGNLLWGFKDGPEYKGDFFGKFRQSAVFEASKKRYPPGWGASDRFADPKFVSPGAANTHPDFRLQQGSPAIDAGVALPAAWPDPLRQSDQVESDIGALPLGAELLGVGPVLAAKW